MPHKFVAGAFFAQIRLSFRQVFLRQLVVSEQFENLARYATGLDKAKIRQDLTELIQALRAGQVEYDV